MRTRGKLIELSKLLVILALPVPCIAVAQEPPPQAPRAIPGINAPDPFPQACVSCHVILPDGRDVRLSALLQRWVGGADSALLAMARAAVPSGMTITGKHPPVAPMITSVPADCLTCHGRNATQAPPFGRLLHLVHLTGESGTLFLSLFQGECTVCHKLDPTSGAWSIPSAPEP